MPKAVKTADMPPVMCYEQLLDAEVDGLPYVWPVLDETTPCGLCYTSGTTGNPKVRSPGEMCHSFGGSGRSLR